MEAGGAIAAARRAERRGNLIAIGLVLLVLLVLAFLAYRPARLLGVEPGTLDIGFLDALSPL